MPPLDQHEFAEYQNELLAQRYEAEQRRAQNVEVPEAGRRDAAAAHASVGHFYEHDPSLNPPDRGPWWDGEWGPFWNQ